ncbi:MAG TPA: arginine repressor [Gemmatimonadales bacterium]|nr:arginine repressor [Gemmatimonadales bacterium]
MKTQRQATILRLIAEQRIGSQDQLREALAGEGVVVTQATLSRDLRDLGLIKVTDPSGEASYAQQPERSSPPGIDRLLPSLARSAEGVGALLVLRTSPGAAALVATALDQAGWHELLGTIAGDDTVLAIARSPRDRELVMQRVRTLLG